MQKERIQAFTGIMERQELGALIFWRPDELVLAMGYMPNWGVSFLLYTRDHDAVLFVPALEPEDVLPPGVAVVRYPWGLLDCADPWQELYMLMQRVLTGKGLQDLPVSFVRHVGGSAPAMMSGEQPPLPPDLVERLSSLTKGGHKDLASDLLTLYTNKTSSDVVALELTHWVASLAVEAFYAHVTTIGQTEASLAAAVEAAVHCTTGLKGVRFARAWAMVQSGTNTQFGGIYNRSSGKELAPGELVMLEMAVCVNGYWADITRTATTSEPSPIQKKIVNAVAQAQRLAIAEMRPGARMQHLDSLARVYIDKAGFGGLFNHALGHQVGFRYHDPGPALSPYSTGVLKEGMVLTVEPGIYGEAIQCGARIEDNILITEEGCRALSGY